MPCFTNPILQTWQSATRKARGELRDGSPDRLVGSLAFWDVTESCSCDSDGTTGPRNRAAALVPEIRHHSSLLFGPYQFFELMYFNSSIGIAWSATSRLSFWFSAMSAFMRLASETSIPLYFFFQT